ncbi:EPM2A-interacting protein 1 [Labeo rohita]|uniref:EPM2A-interacting protein 1 n=1 Tax=Labeo rohita TaxID=84645 RepID=A0ABQ8L9S0_LABRO|nr:EPM2A-interacting protein 1 [Labeo rohita]
MKEHTVLEEWKNQFAVNERDGQPFCLLCRKILGVCKTYNVKRHFDTTYATFDKKYPLGSQERAFQITSLEKNAIAEQNTMRASLKVSQAVTLATFKISWLLAKHGKPFSDGELVKNCFLETQCLFDLSNKNEIIRRIKSLQLSNDTVTRRISEISENLTEQLKTKLTTASALSLAADELDFEVTEDLFALKFYTNEHGARIFIEHSVKHAKTRTYPHPQLSPSLLTVRPQ